MGIMSGNQSAPQVVEDHEKMREFEERLTREKEEMKEKAEEEKRAIEN